MDSQKSVEMQKLTEILSLKVTIFSSTFSNANKGSKQLTEDKHPGISLFMSVCSS